MIHSTYKPLNMISISYKQQYYNSYHNGHTLYVMGDSYMLYGKSFHGAKFSTYTLIKDALNIHFGKRIIRLQKDIIR